jgi:hypothetical protein
MMPDMGAFSELIDNFRDNSVSASFANCLMEQPIPVQLAREIPGLEGLFECGYMGFFKIIIERWGHGRSSPIPGFGAGVFRETFL